MVMMSMKLSNISVKIMAPGSGVQGIGWDQYGHILNLYLIFSTPFYIIECMVMMFMKSST